MIHYQAAQLLSTVREPMCAKTRQSNGPAADTHPSYASKQFFEKKNWSLTSSQVIVDIYL